MAHRKDSTVDTPMTAWWFEGIRIGLKQKRAYGVEKIVEPEVFKKLKTGYSHTNKWRNYQSGARHPRAALIERAENILPGCSVDLDHVIWRVGRLRHNQKIVGIADEWLHRLKLDILPLVFRIDEESGHEVRRGISESVLKKLIHRADLDGLAALSILMREAAEKRNYKITMKIAESLYQALLHAAVRGTEQMRIVLPKIFVMLIERVFPFARDRWRCFSFDGLDIGEYCKLLEAAVEEKGKSSRFPKQRIGPSYVDDLIFSGTPCSFGFVNFYLPKRPIRSSKTSAEEERNFQDFIRYWNQAISRMREQKT